MNKKIGKSIYIGVIIFFMVFSLAGIIYTSFSNVYGKDSDEMFMVHYSTPDKKAKYITTNLDVGRFVNISDDFFLTIPSSVENPNLSSSADFPWPEKFEVYLDGVLMKKTRYAAETFAFVQDTMVLYLYEPYRGYCRPYSFEIDC